MKDYSLEGYITTTARGPARQTAQYGWVLEYVDSQGNLRTKEGFGETEGTETAISIRALGDMLSHLNRPCRVHIHTDCRQIEGAIKNGWLKFWSENDWKNKSGKKIKNKDDWEETWQYAESHELTAAYDLNHSYREWILGEIERGQKCVRPNVS